MKKTVILATWFFAFNLTPVMGFEVTAVTPSATGTKTPWATLKLTEYVCAEKNAHVGEITCSQLKNETSTKLKELMAKPLEDHPQLINAGEKKAQEIITEMKDNQFPLREKNGICESFYKAILKLVDGDKDSDSEYKVGLRDIHLKTLKTSPTSECSSDQTMSSQTVCHLKFAREYVAGLFYRLAACEALERVANQYQVDIEHEEANIDPYIVAKEAVQPLWNAAALFNHRSISSVKPEKKEK